MGKANGYPGSSNADRIKRVQQLVDQVLRRRTAGEELSDETVIAKYSDLMPELAERLKALRVIEQAQRRSSHGDKGSAPPDDAPKIAGYRIERELGHGGMGRVYLAEDLSTKRKVALKVMLAGRQASDRQRRRFEREVEIAASLTHPNVARLYASGLHEGRYWFAMEYIEGERLDRFVEQEKPGVRALLGLFAPICEAVNHAHQRGIMHRDLKPGNILMDGRLQPHVLDFGLAKPTDVRAGDEVSIDGQISGTPTYMSPEQTKGESSAIDVRTDVYSLGVVLYRLLTGQLPYGDETTSLPEYFRAISEVEPAPPRKLRHDLPDEVNAILLKALEKDPANRYQIAGELGQDIRAHLNGRPVTAKQGSGWYMLRKLASRHRKLAAAVAAVVLLSLGLGLVMSVLFAKTIVELRDVVREKEVLSERVVILNHQLVQYEASAGGYLGMPQLLGYWTLDDGQAWDNSGHGHAGTLRGSPERTNGVKGQALRLDGAGDFIEVPHNASLNLGAGDFTICMWVNFKSVEGEQVLIEKWVQRMPRPAPSVGWTLTKHGDGGLLFAMRDGNGPEMGLETAPIQISTGSWHFVAVTRNGTTCTLYWDGVEMGSVECSYNLDSEATLKIGHRGSPSDTPGSDDKRGFYLNGSVDEVGIFDGALSSQYVHALAEAGTIRTLHVNANADGPGDARSWATAYKDLQDALAAAKPGAEIWMVAGTYRPDRGTGDRKASFRLKTGVALYGGFAGGETRRDQRDPKKNKTIFSGDLKGNDLKIMDPEKLLAATERTDNSYHVLIGSGTDSTAILDGLTITGGHAADELYPDHQGGGMHTERGSPTLVRCLITRNSAKHDGGGVACDQQSKPTFVDCIFLGNATSGGGGAINSWLNSNPVIRKCTFRGNYAKECGGAVWHGRCVPSYEDCTFEDNRAGNDGGAMRNGWAERNTNADASLTRCLFIRNRAGNDGGAMRNTGSSPTLIACRFHSNSAGNHGGAISNMNKSSATMSQCIFTGNSVGNHGGAVANMSAKATLVNCTLVGNSAKAFGGGVASAMHGAADLVNCVLWGNSVGGKQDEPAQLANMMNSTATLRHCCIQGWTGKLGGTGNSGADPLFVDADGPDNKPGTKDDDLRLKPGSPCIDKGDATALPVDTADLDSDGDKAEPIPFDLDGKPRVRGAKVDMGAYEVQVATGTVGKAKVYTEWPYDAAEAKERQSETAKTLGVKAEETLDLGKSVTMKLSLIPAGKFTMGSPETESDRSDNEGPQRQVIITKPFYMGATEVTRGQFAAFVADSGYKTAAEKKYGAYVHDGKAWVIVAGASWRKAGFPQTDTHPVACVNWEDAAAFCTWLARKTGRSVSLPTEAQWEYACRAGATTVFRFGDEREELYMYANYCDKSCSVGFPWKDKEHDDEYGFTAPVRSYKPNAFGLYDMHGNVWEWCRDWYDEKFYANAKNVDPENTTEAKGRVLRGGSWFSTPRDCGAACRWSNTPGGRDYTSGFRVVVAPDSDDAAGVGAHKHKDDLTYREDFENGRADGWKLNSGWKVVKEPNGNHVLHGKTHNFAHFGARVWKDCKLRLRVKFIRNGMNINLRHWGHNRYFIDFRHDKIMLRKTIQREATPPWEHFDLREVPWNHTQGQWHTIEFTVRGKELKVCVDDKHRISYEDSSPHTRGGLSLEAFDHSEVYVDDITVIPVRATTRPGPTTLPSDGR